MGGLKKYLPITFFTFLIGVLAISGIPPFAGFFSKDEILASAFSHGYLVWGIAAFTSLLTSFYMFRLFFLTFYGQERANEKAMSHIHESPVSITIPLSILAILSFAGGFMGVPEVLGGSHWLSGFLSPVFAQSLAVVQHHHLEHSTEYMLMATIVGLTIVMILIAYVVYVSKKSVPVAENQELGVLHKTVYNKYFIDEIYNAIIVKPLYWLSEKFDAIVEKLGIDKLVNGVGGTVVWGGKAFRLLQNGSIGFYIFAMVIGILVLITLTVLI
jgi:NADH-quinone oxidoreductase subunit L